MVGLAMGENSGQEEEKLKHEDEDGDQSKRLISLDPIYSATVLQNSIGDKPAIVYQRKRESESENKKGRIRRNSSSKKEPTRLGSRVELGTGERKLRGNAGIERETPGNRRDSSYKSKKRKRGANGLSAGSTSKASAQLAKKWVELEIEGADPIAFVGLECRVFWPLDNYWYKGSISGYSQETKKHNVEYKDGVNFSEERMKFNISSAEMLQLNLKCSSSNLEKNFHNELIGLAMNFHDCQDLDPGDVVCAKITEFGSIRPAFDSTSELPLPLNPKEIVLKGGKKKASGSTPKTPALPKANIAAGQKEKKRAPSEVSAKKASAAEKQKGVLPDPSLPLEKKRKTSSAGGIAIKEPAPKDQTTLVVSNTPSSTQPEAEPTPSSGVTVPVPSSTGPQARDLADTELSLEDFEKYLKEVIPEREKGLGTVWRTHLPEDYPDSLGVHLPGFTGMQDNLTPSASDRARYAREAFRVTSTAEERKLVEEDPQGALDALVYYQHHSGVIAGALKDKYEKEILRLEAPSPIVPQSKAAIIERDFLKSQMQARNRIANLRSLEINGYIKEIANMKGTLQQQQAALVGAEAELAKATARVAEVEKELAARTQQLEKQKEKNEQYKKELPQATIKSFLASYAFTEAATLSCKNMMRAAIYKELKKLSKIYPFDPQRCGFVEVPDEKSVAMILPGFTWDTKSDRLRTPKGKEVKLPVKLESVLPQVIPFRWAPYQYWPKDVNDPSAGWMSEEEGGEDEDLGGEGGVNDDPVDPNINPQAEEDPNPQVEKDPVDPPGENEVPTTEPEAEATPGVTKEEPVVTGEDRVEERTSPPPYSPFKVD